VGTDPATPSPELQLTMDGDASVGYNASFGNQIAGTHNFDFGGSANLKGFYFDPNSSASRSPLTTTCLG